MKKSLSKKLRLIALTLLSISCSALFADLAPPIKTSPKYDLFHSFSGSISAEIAKIKPQGKTGLLVFFNAPSCPSCQRMKNSLLNQASVQQYVKSHFRWIAINTEASATLNDEQQQAMSYQSCPLKQRVRRTPTITLFDENDAKRTQHVGVIANPDKLLWLGECLVERHSIRLSFADFKTNKRLQPTL